jgi:hypothetical protein
LRRFHRLTAKNRHRPGTKARRQFSRQEILFQALFKTPDFWHAHAMTTVAIEKAQQDLVTLVKRALDEEEIVIEADSRKVRLAPVPALPAFDAATARRRGYGSMKGQFEITDAFFEPFPEDELKFWEGRGIE